jgi:hypothetical protein
MRTAEEEWKQITEFGTGLHHVSNMGRVIRAEGFLRTKSMRYVSEMEIKPCMRGKYLCITRRVGGVTKNFNLHAIVAKYFVPNPAFKPCVNHIDGNKLNCRADNLEWVTNSENQIHAYRVLGKKASKTALGKFGKDNKLSKQVKCVETGVIYDSLGLAATDNNVSVSAICLVLKKRNKTANKRTFIYN